MSDKKTHNDNNKQRPLRSNLKEGAGLHLKDPSSELLDDGIPEQSTTTAEPSNDVPHADQEKPGPSADRKVSDPHSADSIATLMGFQPGKEPHSIPGIVHRKRSDSSEDTLWMASSSGTMPIISPSNVALYTPSTPSLGRQKVGVDDDQQVAVDGSNEKNVVSSQRKDSTVSSQRKDSTVSSQRKDSTVDSPKKDSAVDSPKKDSAVDSPQKDSASSSQRKDSTVDSPKKDSPVDSPKKDSAVDSPKKDSPVDSPKKDSAVDSPKKDSAVDSPKKDSAVINVPKVSFDDSPKKDSAVDSPKKDSAVDSPKKDSAVDSPKKDSAVDSPKKDSAVINVPKVSFDDSPKKDSAVDSPKKDSAVDSPKKDSAVDSPKKDSAVDSPKKDSAVDSPKKDSAVINVPKVSFDDSPKKDSAVDSPKKDSAVDSPKKDSAVDSPKKDSTVDSQKKDSAVINVPKVSFDPSVSSHYKGRVVSWAEEVEPEQKFSKVSSDDDLSTDSAKIAQNEQARISIEPTKQHSDIGAPIMMTDAGILKIFPDTGQSKVPPNDELSKVSDIEPTRAVSDTEPSKAVSDTEPSKAVSDIGLSKAVSDIGLSKAVSDVMPSKTIPKIGPSEAVLDVHPSKLGFEVHPSKLGFEVHPSKLGFEVHPSKLDSEVLKSREGTVGKSQEQIIGQDISKGHSYHSMKGHELYGDITSKSPKQGSHSRSSKTSPEKKIIRRQSDRSLHNFMAGSHAALTSAKATGSRFAIQFDTPEGEALERDIWRKKLPNGNEEPIDFDEALQETKFGFFHIALYITCGIIYMACSASLSTLSFTLPASTCALNLTSIDKGQINVFPYIGMLIGTFFWGSISDTKGRKKALLMSLLLDFVAGVLSSFSYNKFMLMLFRVFNGFSIIGATSLVFAYFGEFLTENQGEILLPLIELFYCCGMVYIPALAMLILPYKIHIQIGIIDYQSWNLFTACASIPSFTGLVFVSFFPESPKFTHITGRLQETFDTLKKMYRINTRKSTSKFPVNCLIDSDTAKKLESNKFTLSKVITQQFLDLFSAYKELFGNEMRARTILCCVIDFCFNFGYLTLVIWVPELLERMAKYSSFYKKSAAMCEASEALSTILDQSDSECHTITHDIYVHALVITSSSFPVVIITFLFLRCISKKFILSVLLLLTGISALLFIHVQEQSFMIFLCAMFESSATLLETLLFIIIVEIFPTTIAGTALAVTASSGRFGAIIGNMFIGFFVDSHCQLPVYSFGICFFIAALLVLFLPSKK